MVQCWLGAKALGPDCLGDIIRFIPDNTVVRWMLLLLTFCLHDENGTAGILKHPVQEAKNERRVGGGRHLLHGLHGVSEP